MLNASAILAYSSLTFENPSILPVGLPWASCVWNTSLGRRLAGGGGSPAPFAADLFRVPAPACPPLTSSLSTKCSLVDLFFFLRSPNGILLLFFGASVDDVDERKKCVRKKKESQSAATTLKWLSLLSFRKPCWRAHRPSWLASLLCRFPSSFSSHVHFFLPLHLFAACVWRCSPTKSRAAN